MTGTVSPDHHSPARHPAGVGKEALAASSEPPWHSNYQSGYCLPNDSNWKCKYSRSTLKITHCSHEAAAASEDFSQCRALRTAPPSFPASSPPLCFAFQLFFLLSPWMQTQRFERRKIEDNFCAAYWPYSSFLYITYTGSQLKKWDIFLLQCWDPTLQAFNYLSVEPGLGESIYSFSWSVPESI